MTDLNEKLKLVAKYISPDYNGKSNVVNFCIDESPSYTECSFDIDELKYHTSYDWQIPVWQKVFSELMIFRTSLDKNSFNQKVEGIDLITFNYKVAIFKGTPLESFEILVQAIQFINKMKK